METSPRNKSFNLISASKSINFNINNDDDNKDDYTTANIDNSNSN